MCSTSPDNCDEGFVCVRGRCVFAFPRLYAFTNVEVSVPPLMPGGNEWDPDGGAPDLFLAGETGGPPLFSPVATDVFMTTFPGPLEIPLTGVPLGTDVSVWDSDPPGPEGAFVCRYPNTGFDPRARMFICQGTIGALTATIEPL